MVAWIKISVVRSRPEFISFQSKQLTFLSWVLGVLANKRKDWLKMGI